MDRRRAIVAVGCLVASLHAFAQRGKPYRIGLLGTGSAASSASWLEALKSGLRDLGHAEGKDISFEYRWADGKYDRLATLANELVHLKVDVIVTHGTPGTRAAKQATTTIPIVMASSGDAISAGLVASLARPGANITGSTFFGPEYVAKRLELLKETTPRVTRVAVISNPNNYQWAETAGAGPGPTLNALRAAADSLRVTLQNFEMRAPEELDDAFSKMKAQGVDALVLGEDAMLLANARSIASLALKQRIPLSGNAAFAEAGALIGYGHDNVALWYRAAYFVDKVLKGVKPTDLPVERPAKSELVLNMKTAKMLDIKIPQSMLVRATRVIE